VGEGIQTDDDELIVESGWLIDSSDAKG
jgi:hypothetical protein